VRLRAVVVTFAVGAAGLLPALPASAAGVQRPARAGAGAAIASLRGHRHAKVCAAPSAHHASCHAIVDLDAVTPLATTATPPQGYGPADLQKAYQLPSATAGLGKTVAIVDAYDLPTAANDLNAYRAQYGLSSSCTGCFTKVNQSGGTTLPAANASWGQEIALDLDMVTAACPNCKILLVEANSSSLTDLGTAVNTAAGLGANAISNSYGGSESSSDTTYDTSYYKHPGVAITASSGDSGYGVEYPAASQYVTAVGGTSLNVATSSSGTTYNETAWSGAGSGCSAYDPKPTWQRDSGCSRRTVADVSAVADPNTGVAVYDSTASGTNVGWQVFGGTSAAAPLVAATFALAPTPAAAATSSPASFPYATPTGLNDVTSGTNGSCGSYLCTAVTGYDGPTGLGTPHGVSAFTAFTAGTATPTPPPTTSQQLLGNPGFETGTAPWVASTGVVDNSNGEPAHSGSWKAWLNGYGTSHTDTLKQTVTIPASATSATLSFYLHIDSAETTTSAAYDKLSVQLVNSSGTLLTTLATYSNLNKASGYAQRTFDVTGYKGQSVTLRLTGTEDGSLQTSFVVDDASLTAK